MTISRKIAGGSITLGFAALLAGTALQMPAVRQSLSPAMSPAQSFLRQASDELSPKLNAIADWTNDVVSSNATTARLQFDGMANTIESHFSLDAWLPGSARYWTHGGVKVAAKATSSDAIAIAGKMPGVTSVRSNIQRLSDMHPALHISSAGF